MRRMFDPPCKILYIHIKEENTIIHSIYGLLCTNHLMQDRELIIHKEEYSIPEYSMIHYDIMFNLVFVYIGMNYASLSIVLVFEAE